MLYLYTCADLALSSNAVATLRMQYGFGASRIKTPNWSEYLRCDSIAVSPTMTDMVLDTAARM